MQEMYEGAKELSAAASEDALKALGLHNVEVISLSYCQSLVLLIQHFKNVFWDLNYCDPYCALSWDRLHAYHGGLFSDHIWVEFKRTVNAIGKSAAKKVDKQ